MISLSVPGRLCTPVQILLPGFSFSLFMSCVRVVSIPQSGEATQGAVKVLAIHLFSENHLVFCQAKYPAGLLWEDWVVASICSLCARMVFPSSLYGVAKAVECQNAKEVGKK